MMPQGWSPCRLGVWLLCALLVVCVPTQARRDEAAHPQALALSDTDPFALSTFSDLPSEQRSHADKHRSKHTDDVFDSTPLQAPLNSEDRAKLAKDGPRDTDFLSAAGEEQDTDMLELHARASRATVGTSLKARVNARVTAHALARAKRALARAGRAVHMADDSMLASDASDSSTAGEEVESDQIALDDPKPAPVARMLDEPNAVKPTQLDQPDHAPSRVSASAAQAADSASDGLDSGDQDSQDRAMSGSVDYNSQDDGHESSDAAPKEVSPPPVDEDQDPDTQTEADAAKVPNGSYTKLTLDNANSVVEPKKINAKHLDAFHEASLKKTTEAAQKHSQEQNTKIERSTRLQMTTIEKRKITQEQENKQFEDSIQQRSEQFTKKTRERTQKEDDRLYHTLHEANSKEAKQKKQFRREQALETAKEQAQENTNKVEQEMERKKVTENVLKTNARHKESLQKSHRKFLERAEKHHHEEGKEKHAEELKTKKEDEANQKHQLKVAEREEKHTHKLKEVGAKNNAKEQEEREKQEKRTAHGSWCNCENVQMDFHQHNRWFTCPEGKLMTGVYRNDESQYISALKQFQCCNPCRGNAVMKLYACESVDWSSTIREEGWSKCTDNKYMSGVYKGDNNFIYNLGRAQCCAIWGSRGVDENTCRQKDSWMYSLDRGGWSLLDDHTFLTGIYRSGGPWLFNWEFPRQCNFFSFAVV